MKKKVNTGKLKLEKLTIAKLANLNAIKAGSGAMEENPHTEDSQCIGEDGNPLTAISPTQTINQGPTKRPSAKVI